MPLGDELCLMDRRSHHLPNRRRTAQQSHKDRSSPCQLIVHAIQVVMSITNATMERLLHFLYPFSTMREPAMKQPDGDDAEISLCLRKEGSGHGRFQAR